MGTRNLTIVIDKEGQIKIAQYGQWDGYPSGQGAVVLEFLKSKEKVQKLEANLSKVRFFDAEGIDKEFLDEYDKNSPKWSNEPDNRTPEQKRWFETFITRDLGAAILENVFESDDDEILLKNSYDFGNDTISCEWIYIINFKDNTLTVQNDFKSKPLKVYKLKKLPTFDKFVEELEN
jgi:hypothetical protein